MKTIHVLIVVDALGAATTGSLQDNVYLVDTNKHMGSSGEGTNELFTTCVSSNLGGDTIVWSITPIDPGTAVSIKGFTGAMIDQKFLLPRVNPDNSWSGALIPNVSPAQTVQYSVIVTINATDYIFDPFLNVILA